MTSYLLDANVFIEAKNRHYGFDFCPAFWDWLNLQNKSGKVASIQKVGEELQVGKDDLADWAKVRGDEFFFRPDEVVSDKLKDVSNWSDQAGYGRATVTAFLQGADCWLVAHALAQHGCIVVTHEVPSNATKKVKIPNACKGLGVNYMSPYEMLRQERAEFVLK